MAKKKQVKRDIFEEVTEKQAQLMSMYEDRKLKGYKSQYLLSDIKKLEIEVNQLESQILREEYDLKEFTKLREGRIKIMNTNLQKERELSIELEQVKTNIRVATLRLKSLAGIINENEGEGYTHEIQSKSILEDIDITDFNVNLFCKDFLIENPELSDDDFVLKMFSFFKGNEAFKHYSDNDIALLFRRNFVVEGKRLSFPQIKNLYYADGKTVDSYTKLYKIIRDKFRKHIKFHPADLVF